MTKGLRQDREPLILGENTVMDAAIEITPRCSHFRFLINLYWNLHQKEASMPRILALNLP